MTKHLKTFFSYWEIPKEHLVHQSPGRWSWGAYQALLLQFHTLKKLYIQRRGLWNMIKIRPSYHEENAASTITKYSNQLYFHLNVQNTFISILTKRAPLGVGQTLKIAPCSITRAALNTKAVFLNELLASETSETEAWYLNLNPEIIMLPDFKLL